MIRRSPWIFRAVCFVGVASSLAVAAEQWLLNGSYWLGVETRELTRAELVVLGGLLGRHRGRYGRLPTTSEGLSALTEQMVMFPAECKSYLPFGTPFRDTCRRPVQRGKDGRFPGDELAFRSAMGLRSELGGGKSGGICAIGISPDGTAHLVIGGELISPFGVPYCYFGPEMGGRAAGTQHIGDAVHPKPVGEAALSYEGGTVWSSGLAAYLEDNGEDLSTCQTVGVVACVVAGVLVLGCMWCAWRHGGLKESAYSLCGLVLVALVAIVGAGIGKAICRTGYVGVETPESQYHRKAVDGFVAYLRACLDSGMEKTRVSRKFDALVAALGARDAEEVPGELKDK